MVHKPNTEKKKKQINLKAEWKQEKKGISTEDVLGAGGADDLRAHRCHADLNTGVPIIRKLPRQYLDQLREENPISHELK